MSKHPKHELADRIEATIRDWAHEHADVWREDEDQLLASINHAITEFAHAFPGLRTRWKREIGGEK